MSDEMDFFIYLLVRPDFAHWEGRLERQYAHRGTEKEGSPDC